MALDFANQTGMAIEGMKNVCCWVFFFFLSVNKNADDHKNRREKGMQLVMICRQMSILLLGWRSACLCQSQSHINMARNGQSRP